MLILPLAAFGVWAIAVGWPVQHWAVQTGWTICTGYCVFCIGSCYHEAVHHTLNGSRTLSLWVGRLIGTCLMIPFHVYREVHIRHHAYMNSPADWELWPYSDPQASLTFRRVFVWFDFFFGSIASIYIYNRIFFHPQSPIKARNVRRAAIYEFAVCAVVWSVLVGLIAYYGAWSTFFWAWLLPLGIAGSFQTSRKLTEHLGMPSYDPLLGTRTVICRDLPSRVLAFFHFDIFVHGVHHRHPRLAHGALTPTMQGYADHDPDVGTRVYPYYALAMFDMIPFMFKNPGTGMNAGGGPPHFKDCEEVRTFLTDVTAEVLEKPVAKEERVRVQEARALTEGERELLLDSDALTYFEHYARYSTQRNELFLVKVYRRDTLLGAAPVIKTTNFNGIRLLEDRTQRWLTPLGPFARTTSYTVDTSLAAFVYRSPFFCASDHDRPAVRQAVSNHLKAKQDGDTVFIAEPLAETAWTLEHGYDPFLALPMARIDVSLYDNYQQYLEGLSKKRRKNIRQARREFDNAGAAIETFETLDAIDEKTLDGMVHCLRESAKRSSLTVPWDEVGNNEEAFRTLPQAALVARHEGRVAAFMSFITCGDQLLQCHGGLDYDDSHDIKAYHNLIAAAAEYALRRGLKCVSFGPLNNETKRRGASELLPVAGNLWTRNPLLRPFNRSVLIPHLQVFTGPLKSPPVVEDDNAGPPVQPPASRADLHESALK
jgi:fatty acid desaturase